MKVDFYNDEYIKRKDAIEAITYVGMDKPTDIIPCTLAVAQKKIMRIPAADVAEVKHAYWKTVTEIKNNTVCGDGVKIQKKVCSNCEQPMGVCGNDYCGHCGAIMDAKSREENIITQKNISNHKYTDEEVIRACECCASLELSCIDCPAGDTPLCGMSDKLLLEIVHRQRAEIERLKKDNEYILMQHKFQRRPSGDCWNDVIEKAKSEAVKEFAASLLGYVEGYKMTAEKRHKARGNGASRDYTVGKMYAYGKVVEFLHKYMEDKNGAMGSTQ